MGKFGVGIVGCGGISGAHAKGYLALGDQCEIKAVSDLYIDKAERLASNIGGEVDVYKDYQDLLARPDIDVVSICTPPYAHKAPVIDALKAGKHVLVEKPFAGSLQDCDEMIETSRAACKNLCVTFQYRYRQDFNQIRHLIRSGAIAPITFAQMSGLYWRGNAYYAVPWRGNWDTECGGVTMNHAIHPLDIFLWLMGDPESVYAEMDTAAHEVQVEDVSMAMLRFRSGAMGQIACTVNSVKSDIRMEFSGLTKAASIPLAFHAVKQNEGGFPVPDEDGVREMEKIAGEIAHGTDDHTGLINDLFMSIREKREPLVNGTEARRVIEVITGIYKSATTGMRVTFPIRPDDPWYTTEGLHRLVRKAPIEAARG